MKRLVFIFLSSVYLNYTGLFAAEIVLTSLEECYTTAPLKGVAYDDNYIWAVGANGGALKLSRDFSTSETVDYPVSSTSSDAGYASNISALTIGAHGTVEEYGTADHPFGTGFGIDSLDAARAPYDPFQVIGVSSLVNVSGTNYLSVLDGHHNQIDLYNWDTKTLIQSSVVNLASAVIEGNQREWSGLDMYLRPGGNSIDAFSYIATASDTNGIYDIAGNGDYTTGYFPYRTLGFIEDAALYNLEQGKITITYSGFGGYVATYTGFYPQPVNAVGQNLALNQETHIFTLSFAGISEATYRIIEAPNLDFSNPTQTVLAGASIGILNDNTVTTDARGLAEVQFPIGSSQRMFYRLEKVSAD